MMGKKYNQRAHLKKENKSSTICISLCENDKIMYHENIQNRKSNNYLQKYDSGH